ncbi:DUF3299 domain-containing protein [Endozoicomonas sp. OPT23]|uniref:DUF3299 domain-containing protein n=1 Tax=Endozoicomonas sp. OPT23 TaxID=2072845 RepID=UPI00129A83CD
MTGRLLAAVLLVASTAIPVQVATASEVTKQEPLAINWKSLTPDIDPEIYKKYRTGKLSQTDLRLYMETFHNTARTELAGKNVALTGYLLPQNLQENGKSTEFLFVRKITSWSHTDQVLKPNQATLVNYPEGLKFNQSTQVRYQVTGKMNVGDYTGDDIRSFYKIEATDIKVKRRRFNEYD